MKIIEILLRLIGVSLISMQCSFANATDTKNTVDAYNHLTVSMGFLRHGYNAQLIRDDILGNVNLSGVSSDVQAIYKRVLSVADRVIKLKAQSQALEARQKDQQAKQQNTTLLNMFLTMYSGGTSLPLLLDTVSSLDAQKQKLAQQNNHITHIDTQEFSEIEFDLSVARENISKSNKIDHDQFITTKAFEEYFKNETASNTNSTTQELVKLVGRYPALYFVQYKIGHRYAKNNDWPKASQHLTLAVQYAPSVLHRSSIRVNSLSELGSVMLKLDKSIEAKGLFNQALNEDPTHIPSLIRLADYHIEKGNTKLAAGLLEKALRIDEHHGEAIYTLARYGALTGKSHEQIEAKVKQSLNNGFSDIARIKKDALITRSVSTEFLDTLKNLHPKIKVKWRMGTPDKLIITNTDIFHWDNVKVYIAYRKKSSTNKERTPISLNKDGLYVKRIPMKGSEIFDAFKSTRYTLDDVALKIVTDQGIANMYLVNRKGELIPINTSYEDVSQ